MIAAEVVNLDDVSNPAAVAGEYTGDGGRVRDVIQVHYFRGDQIKLRVRNTDTANSHYVVGSLELEEVAE